MEEVDYSEEAKYDLFESVTKDRLDWAKCIIARTPPNYEDVKQEMENKELSLSRKDYEKVCKEMGLKWR